MRVKKLYIRILLLVIFIFSCRETNAQNVSDMNGGFFKLGINYFQPTKPGLANYLQDFSDSLQFPNAFTLEKGYGISLDFISHHNAFEFEAGGDVLWAHHFQNVGDTMSGTVTSNDINLNFGLNFLPVRWFYIGLGLSICNSSEKYKAGDQATNVSLDSQGDGFSNIFNGYSIGLKGQAGFNFNVSKKGDYTTYLRLAAFYELGLTEFDFYKTFENRLQYFQGDTKTKLSYPGVTLSMQFGTK